MNWFVKLFIPKPAKIARIAAEAVANAVNASDKTDLIKQYDGYAVKLTELQTFIVKLLEDGKIDAAETDKITEMLTPVVEKIMEKI